MYLQFGKDRLHTRNITAKKKENRKSQKILRTRKVAVKKNNHNDKKIHKTGFRLNESFG